MRKLVLLTMTPLSNQPLTSSPIWSLQVPQVTLVTSTTHVSAPFATKSVLFWCLTSHILAVLLPAVSWPPLSSTLMSWPPPLTNPSVAPEPPSSSTARNTKKLSTSQSSLNSKAAHTTLTLQPSVSSSKKLPQKHSETTPDRWSLTARPWPKHWPREVKFSSLEALTTTCSCGTSGHTTSLAPRLRMSSIRYTSLLIRMLLLVINRKHLRN